MMTVGGTNLELAHRHNRRAVFESLRVNGPLSRSEIARATGLAKQTIANIVEPMIAQGLLREGERRSGARGQPAKPLQIAPEGAHAVGVHVDYHRILGVVVDLEGRTIKRSHRYLQAVDLAEITVFLRRMNDDLRAGQQGEYLGLGVATPGPFGTDAATPPGLGVVPGWLGTPVAEMLASEFGGLVSIENDATAAAVGERRIGAGMSFSDFIYLYLGIGVGAGLVLDGSLYRGPSRNAGELGLLPQPGGGGKTYEESLSLVALCKRLGWPPYDAVTQERLQELPLDDDALEGWLAEAAAALSQAVLTLEMLFDPECIIVGGLIPQNIIVRLIDSTELIPSVALRRNRLQPRLIAGAGDPWSAAIGAAASRIAASFDPGFSVLQKL